MSDKRFSDVVMDKARQLMMRRLPDGRPAISQDLTYPAVWWAVPRYGKDIKYKVSIIGRARLDEPWVSCTCPHGLVRGTGQARCYHAAAVLMMAIDLDVLRAHKPLGTKKGVNKCTCGWPSDAERAKHHRHWTGDFAQHKFEMRRQAVSY